MISFYGSSVSEIFEGGSPVMIISLAMAVQTVLMVAMTMIMVTYHYAAQTVGLNVNLTLGTATGGDAEGDSVRQYRTGYWFLAR